MPVHIFIQGEKFSNTQNIVQWIASRTGWPVVTDGDLIQQAGSRFGMGAEQLQRALFRRNPVMKRAVQRRKKAAACLRTSLAETLRAEAGIFCGMAGHLIPEKMPHILRVLVTDDPGNRIHRASRDRQIPEKKARRQIKKTDHQSFQWHCHFGSDHPHGAAYDVVVPSEVLETEAAARLILDHLTEKANAAPDEVGRAIDDFALAAGVQLALAEKGYDVMASADNGQVLLTVDRKVFRLKRMTEKLKRLVGEMPDVAGVEVKVGQNFHQADIYRRSRFEMSPGTQFRNYAKRRRNLRQSAIRRLPEDVREQARPNQMGLERSLSL